MRRATSADLGLDIQNEKLARAAQDRGQPKIEFQTRNINSVPPLFNQINYLASWPSFCFENNQTENKLSSTGLNSFAVLV